MGVLQSLRLTIFVCLSIAWVGTAAAQPVDRDLLDRLRERAQEQVQDDSTSALDSERRRARDLELQREEERAPRDEDRQIFFSAIERDYQDRLGQAEARQSYYDLLRTAEIEDIPVDFSAKLARRGLIQQYGYDFVRSRTPNDLPLVGRVDESYQLGVGDTLVISFYGADQDSLTVPVDSNGRIILPDMPPVEAAGLSLRSFRGRLEQLVAERRVGTSVDVALGAPRLIQVSVFGEVDIAGQYALPAYADILDLLSLAGGILKTGSLRRLKLVSAEGSRAIDLYAVFSGDRGADLALEDGDRLIVPVIGPTFATAGSAVRDAIYELGPTAQSRRLNQVLDFVGRGYRPSSQRLLIQSLGPSGREQLNEATGDGVTVQPNDILVFQPKGAAQLAEVRLEGAVNPTGPRPLAQFRTLAALLQDGAVFTDEAYYPFAILRRIDPLTGTRRLTAVNPVQVLLGEADHVLAPRDAVYVLTHEQIAYLASEDVRDVVLGLEDEPECDALRYLQRIVSQSSPERFGTLRRNSFVQRRRQRDGAVAGSTEQLRQSGAGNVAELGRETRQEQSEQRQTRRQRLGLPDVQEEEERNCNAFFDGEPDFLVFALEQSISINGAVGQAGLYPVASGISALSALDLAGGLSPTADRERLEIEKLAGTAARRRFTRYAVSAEELAADPLQVTPGSTINVDTQQTDSEAGTVLLVGEVARPGIYTVRRDETLLELLERAGGYTDQAYPPGVIFTRESIREQQQESLRRAASDLNNALALASIRGDVEADAIDAARNLAFELANVEVPGRLVVEAGVEALQSNPAANIPLQPGDQILVPKLPTSVTVNGDVLSPQALPFRPDFNVRDYIEASGGFQPTADRKRTFIVHPNGVAEPVKLSAWSFKEYSLEPGAAIVVPKKVQPNTTLEIVREVSTILSQLALTAASLSVLSN